MCVCVCVHTHALDIVPAVVEDSFDYSKKIHILIRWPAKAFLTSSIRLSCEWYSF